MTLFRSFQKELYRCEGVTGVQLGVLHIGTNKPMQLWMIVTTRGEIHEMFSHRAQQIIRELRAVLELALLIEFEFDLMQLVPNATKTQKEIPN